MAMLTYSWQKLTYFLSTLIIPLANKSSGYPVKSGYLLNTTVQLPVQGLLPITVKTGDKVPINAGEISIRV